MFENLEGEITMKNAGYEIIRRKHLTDNFDAVIGYDPENPMPYVCWLYNKDGDTYGHGTYYEELRDFDDAMEGKRYLVKPRYW